MITAGPLRTTDLAATMRASIRGDVVTPEDASFPAATFGVVGTAPELVVIAAGLADVAQVVTLAGRTGRRVVAQITGRPTVVRTERTIVVVTRLLANVQVDAARRTATIGIGASWRQVLDAAEPFGLTALSAAAGRLRRQATAFAFAADRIRSFEVITATGDRRLIEPDDADFHALRQGQTAPGLVVAMVLDLVPHPALTVAELQFAAADAQRVLAGWQPWAAALPPTAATGCGVGPGGDTLVIRVAQVGQADRWDALLASLRAAVAVIPVAVSGGPATVAEVVRGINPVDRLALAA